MTEPPVPLEIVDLGPSWLALVGDLDVATVPALEEQLAECDGDVFLDCSGLTFVDSSGLGLFMRTRNACEARGAKFALAAPSRNLLRLLEITGLDTVLLTSDEDELAL